MFIWIKGVKGSISNNIKVVEGGSGDAAPPVRDVVEQCKGGFTKEDDVVAGANAS